jgi:hypothetical protein
MNMKLLPKLLAATSIFAATAAIAGPPVTVTFKNQGTANATYTIITRGRLRKRKIKHAKPVAAAVAA